MFGLKTKMSCPTKERFLTAQEYLLDIKYRQDVIENVEFVPPKMGKAGFGSFFVTYNTHILPRVKAKRL